MIERNLILDYILVRGMPRDVQQQVQNLIARCEGWQPKGKPKIMDFNGDDIIVQCMVKYNENNND